MPCLHRQHGPTATRLASAAGNRVIEPVTWQAEGRAFAGAMAAPEGAARGGVLFLHGGTGLGDHERERIGRLAEAGYIAFAPDLFGERFTDRARGMAVIGGFVEHPAVLRARVSAAWLRLAAQPGVPPAKTAVVGHCFGGFAALELARSGAAVKATVSFHGGLTAREPAHAGSIRGSVLVCTGAADPFCPPEHRSAFEAEMTGGGADWQMYVYGGAAHGFTLSESDPARHPGVRYDERSDLRSWRAMLDLLGERLQDNQTTDAT